MRAAALQLILWIPFLFFLWKLRRGWRTWSDFVQVAIAGFILGATDRIAHPEPVKMIGFAIGASLTACLILYLFGPGTLPAPGNVGVAWELYEPSRRAWARGRWLLFVAIYSGFAASILWVGRWLPGTVPLALTACTAAASAGGYAAWRRTIEIARSS